jgi:hypothetical protein
LLIVDLVAFSGRLIKVSADRQVIAVFLFYLKSNVPFFFRSGHTVASIASKPVPKYEDEPGGIKFRNGCVD